MPALSPQTVPTNPLVYGDTLPILREHVGDGTIDLGGRMVLAGSPRWRPVAWLSAAWVTLMSLQFALMPGPLWNFSFATNPLGIDGARGILMVVKDVNILLAITCSMLSATAVIGRFRRSRGDERQQLKWFAYGAALLIACAPLGMAGVAAPLVTAAQVGIPVAAGIAILKYRLLDIDVIINRTLVYGTLTALLALLYWGSVVVLQQLFRPVIGPDNNLAIVASTLAIAALFQPLRRRIQGTIDRHFYRRQYDAAKTLQAFSTKLRDEVDLNRLTDDLLAVVEATMQPAHVSLWLRDPSSPPRRPHPSITPGPDGKPAVQGDGDSHSSEAIPRG